MGFCEGVGMIKKEISWKMQTNMRFGGEPCIQDKHTGSSAGSKRPLRPPGQ